MGLQPLALPGEFGPKYFLTLEAYLKHVAGLNSPFTFSRSGTSAARLLTIQTRRSGVLTSFIFTFPYDLELCPVETLKQYETLTTSLRHHTSTSLFIVSVKPHEPVTFATIAWWLCEVLKLAVREVSTYFSGRLVRGASVSAATGACITPNKAADWILQVILLPSSS